MSHEHPALRQRGTVALIRAVAETGLIDLYAAEDLESDYRFMLRHRGPAADRNRSSCVGAADRPSRLDAVGAADGI